MGERKSQETCSGTVKRDRSLLAGPQVTVTVSRDVSYLGVYDLEPEEAAERGPAMIFVKYTFENRRCRRRHRDCT